MLFVVFNGFGAAKPLLQQFSAAWNFWAGEELIIGLLMDSEDSVSVCSQRTYFTARSRAKPRVITCSRSMLIEREERRVIQQWDSNYSKRLSFLDSKCYLLSCRFHMEPPDSSLFSMGPPTVWF